MQNRRLTKFDYLTIFIIILSPILFHYIEIFLHTLTNNQQMISLILNIFFLIYTGFGFWFIFVGLKLYLLLKQKTKTEDKIWNTRILFLMWKTG